MKIIGEAGGKNNDKKFIVEITKNELMKITGELTFLELEVGDEIRIGEMFDWLIKLRHRKEELKEAQQQLRALADLMETVEPTIRKALEENEEES